MLRVGWWQGRRPAVVGYRLQEGSEQLTVQSYPHVSEQLEDLHIFASLINLYLNNSQTEGWQGLTKVQASGLVALAGMQSDTIGRSRVA